MDNVHTEVLPARHSPYPHARRASSKVEMRQVRCCCGVGTAPESGTFRSAQSFLIGISRGRAGKEVASAMQCRELPAGPWRNQCCLREVQGQQGLLYFEPGHQLSRDQHGASPCLAGKGALSSRLSSHPRSHMALSKS